LFEDGARGIAAFSDLERAMARAAEALAAVQRYAPASVASFEQVKSVIDSMSASIERMNAQIAAMSAPASTIVAAQNLAASRAALYPQYATQAELEYVQRLEREQYPPQIATAGEMAYIAALEERANRISEARREAFKEETDPFGLIAGATMTEEKIQELESEVEAFRKQTYFGLQTGI